MRIVGNPPSGGKKPTTPTIGTATDGGTGTTVSVAFTPSTYIGKGTITYTATSSPGSLTGTGSGSPITVSGLTTGTAYTFTVNGTTNYGVTSDSSAASNSVTPASPSSFESIATFTGNGTASTYTFSSIPSTYKSLQLRFNAMFSTVGQVLNIRLNSVSTASYSQHILSTGGSTVTAGGNTASTFMTILGWNYGAVGGSNPNTGIIDIIDYASTTKNKVIRHMSGGNSNTASSQELNLFSGALYSTSAVSSLTIYSGVNFQSGTTIALYGIK